MDQFAAETAQALAEIVSPGGRQAVRGCEASCAGKCVPRVLDPFQKSTPPYLPWEGVDYNWSAVCAGSIGCAGICLMQEEPERLERPAEKAGGVASQLSGRLFRGRGLHGGTGLFHLWLRLLRGLCGYAVPLYGRKDRPAFPEACHRIALFQQKCYFPSGRTLSFSDGSTGSCYQMGLDLLPLRADIPIW